MKTHGVKKRSQNSKILFEIRATTLVAMLMILFGIVGPTTAEPVTVSYSGIIDLVDDPFGQLDGAVVVGGTFSGTYTFESTAENQGTSTFAQYLYDEEAPIGMTMTATVGNYTFQTDNFDLVNFTSNIYVKNNDGVTPRDAYSLMTREIIQTAGPDLGLGVNPMAVIRIELITFVNLSTFTDVNLPLTMPDLANFESTNRFTLNLDEVDALVRGHLTSLQTMGTILYVDNDASGSNDGSSWTNAYNYLQDALAVAVANDQIWVAAGTYRPDENTANPGGTGVRGATFQLINGVAIYGGFPSGGSAWAGRDSNLYETILSGDLDGDDVGFTNNGENSYHVVTGSGTDVTAVLDGFTSTDGNANGGWPNNFGGGMFNDVGSPTLTNCTFSGNSAVAGGGMSNFSNSSPTVTNCTFSGNSADFGAGGGMMNWTSSPTVTNCTFSGNSAGSSGGGMYNSDSSPTVTNCTFSGNLANNSGGGMFNWNNSSTTVTNSTFSGNSASNFGGGMFNDDSSLTVSNCILWGDTAGSDGNEMAVANLATIDVNYCDVQGGQAGIFNSGSTINWGSGNIDADPQFVDADGLDDIVGTEDDNLRLLFGSPCIDAGDNTAVPGGVTTDLDGNPRFVDTPTPDTGSGTAPIVDMGAYEMNCGLSDVDGDGVGDLCDVCPADANDVCDPNGSGAWEIDPDEGGTIETPDGLLIIEIEPNDLDEPVTISVTQILPQDPNADLMIGPNPGWGQAIAVYDLQPDGLVFNNPVTVTITIDVTGLNDNQRDRVGIYFWDDILEKFVLLETMDCNIVEDPPGTFIKTCTVEVDHFSIYAVVLPMWWETLAYGDLTGEGATDIDDLLIMAGDWLQSDSIADIAPPPDGDNMVDFADFAITALHWLEGTGN